MSQFKPTHRLDTGTLVELEHSFVYRFYGNKLGLFHRQDGSYGFYPMSSVTELPKVIQVAAHEEPEPLMVAPEVGSTYWIVDSMEKNGVRMVFWDGDAPDRLILAAGDAYATKEDALAARAARQRARGFA